MVNSCLIATIRNGKLYLRSKKSKKCKKKKQTAQDIIDQSKTKRIVYS